MVAVGQTNYNIGSSSISGTGTSWVEAELEDALKGDVAKLVFDDAAKTEAAELLASIPDTSFAKEGLERVLTSSEIPENWRVGEAIAEAYLTKHRGCTFPWPDGRDQRTPRASLPGADLVGFHLGADGDRFAFGEVKTSSEAKSPPQVMTGHSGLTKQLEGLRDQIEIKDELVKYLLHRALEATWKDRYVAAATRYFEDEANIQLHGVLVRDVQPDPKDLNTRVEALRINCPGKTGIELLAIYLPADKIEGLGARVVALRQGSSA